MNFLIALIVNLAGMSVIYSLMAFALARLRWCRRGVSAVLAAILVAGQFWIVPTLLVRSSTGADLVSYSLLFCNWLILGFSIIILCQAVKGIPRQLEDSARLDGCGLFGTYWHVLLPFVRRELWLIVFLTLMGTSSLVVGLQVIWRQFASGPGPGIDLMMGTSLIATLPLIVVFFFAKDPLLKDGEHAG